MPGRRWREQPDGVAEDGGSEDVVAQVPEDEAVPDAAVAAVEPARPSAGGEAAVDATDEVPAAELADELAPEPIPEPVTAEPPAETASAPAPAPPPAEPGDDLAARIDAARARLRATITPPDPD